MFSCTRQDKSLFTYTVNACHLSGSQSKGQSSQLHLAWVTENVESLCSHLEMPFQSQSSGKKQVDGFSSNGEGTSNR